jgi:hypothetical protein
MKDYEDYTREGYTLRKITRDNITLFGDGILRGENGKKELFILILTPEELESLLPETSRDTLDVSIFGFSREDEDAILVPKANYKETVLSSRRKNDLFFFKLKKIELTVRGIEGISDLRESDFRYDPSSQGPSTRDTNNQADQPKSPEEASFRETGWIFLDHLDENNLSSLQFSQERAYLPHEVYPEFL